MVAKYLQAFQMTVMPPSSWSGSPLVVVVFFDCLIMVGSRIWRNVGKYLPRDSE